MRACSSFLALLFFSTVVYAAPAILIEESGTTARERPAKYSEMTSYESWSTIFEFRERRKVGVGASFLGRSGFVGLETELNLLPEHSMLASIGGGPGYKGTSIGWKWTPLHGKWHPTLGMSMAAWTADDASLNGSESIPSFFSSKGDSKSDVRLRQIYFIPSVGLQTIKLEGEGAGAQFFVEVLLFARVAGTNSTFALQPLGSVGAKYFF